MPSIGEQLRQARRARELDLSACEDGTKIRAKYLAAMEDERFDALPDRAYVRGFLRSYASFLGLDDDAIVDAYEVGQHDAPPRPAEAPPPALIARPARKERGGVAAAAVALLVGVVAVLTVALWLAGTSPDWLPLP